MKAIFVLCVVLTLLQPIIFIVGMIKPSIIIPKRWNMKNSRLKIFTCCFLCFFIFAIIGGISVSNDYKDDENNIIVQENKEEKEYYTITISMDSAILISYKYQFDSLYNNLLALDNGSHGSISRSGYHELIQNLLFEKWWNAMDSYDSTRISLPLSDAEYKKACLLYDKQLARYILYGDEDKYMVRYWAEYNAKKVLRKSLKDPKSLIIKDEDIGLSKTSQGWKCIVPYRAKNSFGGYVVEKLTLIMNYNSEDGIYECIDIY